MRTLFDAVYAGPKLSLSGLHSGHPLLPRRVRLPAGVLLFSLTVTGQTGGSAAHTLRRTWGDLINLMVMRCRPCVGGSPENPAGASFYFRG